MNEGLSQTTRERLKRFLADRKLGRTVRQFLANAVAEKHVKRRPSPPGRMFLPRLAYVPYPKVRRGEFDLDRSVASVVDFWVFLDTSYFDRTADLDILRKLRVRNRLFVVREAAEQLKPWARGAHARGARDFFTTDGEPRAESLELWTPEKFLRDHEYAYRYYVHLLALRRGVLRAMVDAFEAEKGRPATQAELRQIFQEAHDSWGPRAYGIAKKPPWREDRRLDVTDEVVVVAAVLCGIAYGRECMILGKDEDLVEQFYKLTSLLKVHLGGHLFARHLVGSGPGLKRFPLSSSAAPFSQFMVGEGNFLVERPPDLDFLLPARARASCLYCWLMGDYFSGMTFCAEDALLGLLDCKERTQGSNTEVLGGMNCHIHPFPIPVPDPRKAYAAVLHDKLTPADPTWVRAVDLHHALACDETTVVCRCDEPRGNGSG